MCISNFKEMFYVQLDAEDYLEGKRSLDILTTYKQLLKVDEFKIPKSTIFLESKNKMLNI